MDPAMNVDKTFGSSRRSHRKTRTGCNNCKRRKIKCGEGKPSCLNCIKHSIRCDYSRADAAAAKSAAAANAFAAASPHGSPIAAAPTLYGNDPVTQPGNLPLSLIDLEVFHHFCSSTYLHINSDPAVKELWRTTVPEMACTNELLMRALLAVSSLHMATLRPDQSARYYNYSMQQHQIALRQGTSALQGITAETCNHLHLFSVLTSIHSLGRPRNIDDFVIVGESGIVQWILLYRGVSAIIEQYQPLLAAGPLAPLCRAREQRVIRHQSYDHLSEEYLRDLLTLIQTTTGDEIDIGIYSDAIKSLEKSYKVMYNIPVEQYESGDVFIWLFRLSDGFLTRVKDGRQEALAIFAHCCVLFKKIEHLWWVQGLDTHMLANIWGFLDEEHRRWIEVPIAEIGWTPSS